MALWILAITWLFAALGLVARSVEAAGNYGFALLFLPYLSSAFVPTDTMPSGLRWISDHQPITPLIESIRGLLLGTDPGTAPLLGRRLVPGDHGRGTAVGRAPVQVAGGQPMSARRQAKWAAPRTSWRTRDRP